MSSASSITTAASSPKLASAQEARRVTPVDLIVTRSRASSHATTTANPALASANGPMPASAPPNRASPIPNQTQQMPNGKPASPLVATSNTMPNGGTQAPQTVTSKDPKAAAQAATDMRNIVRRKLTGYVGFANLPNQWHRKSVRKGFNFNVMVVGKCAARRRCDDGCRNELTSGDR